MDCIAHSCSNFLRSISTSVNKSNSIPIFFKAACQANSGTERNFAGSSSSNSKAILLTFSKTSALQDSNHDILQNFYVKSFQTLLSYM